MAHPFYSRCMPLVNKPITVHHVNGNRYYGVLQRVTPTGLYLTPQPGLASISGVTESDTTIRTTEFIQDEPLNAELVFFPFFFPFAALAGFTLGFVAGAAVSRYPRYPYGGYY